MLTGQCPLLAGKLQDPQWSGVSPPPEQSPVWTSACKDAPETRRRVSGFCCSTIKSEHLRSHSENQILTETQPRMARTRHYLFSQTKVSARAPAGPVVGARCLLHELTGHCISALSTEADPLDLCMDLTDTQEPRRGPVTLCDPAVQLRQEASSSDDLQVVRGKAAAGGGRTSRRAGSSEDTEAPRETTALTPPAHLASSPGLSSTSGQSSPTEGGKAKARLEF